MTDCSVGGDHEGLDHPRGFVGPLHLHAQFILAVKARSQFGVVEVQANFTALPNGCERQHLIVGFRLKHVPVGDVGLDVDDRFVGVGVHDIVPVVKVHADDHGQSVNIGSKRTQVVGEFWWQHRKHRVRQIDRSRTGGGRTVERRAGLHVMGHVSDGHPEGSLAVFLHQTNSVVEILGVGRVDGHQRKMAQIGASSGDFGVPIHLAESVSVVHQRGVVGAGEGVVAVLSASLKPCVEQFSRRPAFGHHHQERHGGLVFPEPEPRASSRTFACLFHEVKALHGGASLVVKGVGLGQGLASKHGLPNVLEQGVHRHVFLAGFFGGERRPSVQRRLAFSSVSAEEILPAARG